MGASVREELVALVLIFMYFFWVPVVKSTTTRCSYLHKSSVGNLQLEPRLHKEDRSQADAERLTMGKEVEITPPNVESPPIFSLRSKSPSLDDVYNQAKGDLNFISRQTG